MSERFDPTTDLSTPPTVVRWDLGERPAARRAGEKVCGIRLGERLFALPARWIRGLRQIEAVTAVPLTPVHVLGVAALEGKVLPLLDPGPILRIPGSRQGPPWTSLWISTGELSVLLAVDQVVAFEPLQDAGLGDDEGAAGSAPDRVAYTSGEAALFGGPAPLLDLPLLLEDARPRSRPSPGTD